MEYSSALLLVPEEILRGFMVFSSYVIVRHFSGGFALCINKLTFLRKKGNGYAVLNFIYQTLILIFKLSYFLTVNVVFLTSEMLVGVTW